MGQRTLLSGLSAGTPTEVYQSAEIFLLHPLQLHTSMNEFRKWSAMGGLLLISDGQAGN